MTTAKIAVKTKNHICPEAFDIDLTNRFFDNLVVAIKTITDKPKLIIKILLPRAEPKEKSYSAILEA